MKSLTLLVVIFMFGSSTVIFAQSECDQMQKAVDQLLTDNSVSWQMAQQLIGNPQLTQSTVVSGQVRNIIDVFQGCYVQFFVSPEGKIRDKKFALGTYPWPHHVREPWNPRYIPLEDGPTAIQ
jgi:hypothetical protein